MTDTEKQLVETLTKIVDDLRDEVKSLRAEVAVLRAMERTEHVYVHRTWPPADPCSPYTIWWTKGSGA